jgi:hypothetical protein
MICAGGVAVPQSWNYFLAPSLNCSRFASSIDSPTLVPSVQKPLDPLPLHERIEIRGIQCRKRRLGQPELTLSVENLDPLLACMELG